jgi:hypothetical protein
MMHRYKWKQVMASLLALLLAAAQGWAQTAPVVLNGYSFQAQAGTYVPLSGGTRVPNLEADEATSRVPLGFTYAVAGKFYTEVTLSSNGWLFLGQVRKYFALANASEFYRDAEGDWLAAPLWANLSGAGGQATYQTTGTAPNRVFVMEWRNWRWDEQAPAPSISFQARLFETTNKVEFSYQPEAGAVSATSSWAPAAIGLYNSATGRLALSDASAAPTLTGSSPNITARPAAGQRYSFTPTAVVPCPAPLSARVERTRRTSVRVAWANARVGGTYAVHYGPRGFVAGSPDDHLADVQPADTAQLTGLQVNVNYQFYVELNCGVGVPSRSPRVDFFTTLIPSNDEGYRAQLLRVMPSPDPGTAGYTTEATPSLPAGSCTLGTGVVRDVWYMFTATSSRHTLRLTGPGAVLEVRSGWSAGSRSLGCVVAQPNGAYPATKWQLPLSDLVVGQVYFVRVYSQLAGTAGTDFRLSLVETGTPPANDGCATATPLPAAQPYGTPPLVGSLQFATNQSNASNSCTNSSEYLPDVWYSFEGSANLEAYFLPTFNGEVQLYNTSCPTLSGIGQCFRTAANVPVRYRPQGLLPGTRYLLRVSRAEAYVQAASYGFQLGLTQLPTAPANDNCAGAVTLVLGGPATAGTIAAATPTAGLAPATGCTGTPAATSAAPEDVWYKFTAPAQPVLLTLASDFTGQLEVRPGTCGSLGSSLGCVVAQAARYGGAFSAQPGQVLLSTLTPGAEYLVRVFGVQPGSMGERDFTLKLAPAPAPPPNDEPATATVMTISPQTAPLQGTVTGNVAGATPSLAGSAEPDVWYKVLIPSYPVSVRVLSQGGPTVEIRGDAPSYQLWTAFGSQANIRPYPFARSLNYNFKPGQTCYIRVVASPNDTPPPYPDFELGIAPTVANDEPCDALPLPLSGGGSCAQPVYGTTLGATYNAQIAKLNPAVNCTYANAENPDVWYRFRATNAALTLRCDDDLVKLLRLFEAPATCTDDLKLVGCQSVFDNTNTAVGTVFFDQLTVGKEYLLAVSDLGSTSPFKGEFTLCAEASNTLPTRPGAPEAALGLWPNPVEAGQPLTVQVPAGCATLRAEWLSAVGQRLGGPQAPVTVRAGQVQLPTEGRAPGLYLLRLWQPDGQPLPVRRVLVR